jgi:hypothetical protein
VTPELSLNVLVIFNAVGCVLADELLLLFFEHVADVCF